MSTFHHIVSEFEREYTHLKSVEKEHCVRSTFCINKSAMDDENNANFDAIFTNCRNDSQLFLNTFAKYLRSKTNFFAGDYQHILSETFANAANDTNDRYVDEQQQLLPIHKTSTDIVNDGNCTNDDNSRDLFDDADEIIPETQDFPQNSNDSGESICIPFYDKPKGSDSQFKLTNASDDDSEFVRVRPESNAPDSEVDDLQSQFLMANIEQNLICDPHTSNTSNEQSSASSSTHNVSESIEAHVETVNVEMHNTPDEHCVDRSGCSTPDLDFVTCNDGKAKEAATENEPQENRQNDDETQMPSDSFFEASTQQLNGINSPKQTSTDDIFEVATQVPVFKHPAPVFSTPKAPIKQKSSTPKDSIFDAATQQLVEEEEEADIFEAATQVITTEKISSMTKAVSSDESGKTGPEETTTNHNTSDDLFEMDTQIIEPQQIADLNGSDIFEVATQMIAEPETPAKIQNKRGPLIVTQCSQAVNTPEWSMAARIPNAQIDQYEKERAELEAAKKKKQKLQKHRFLFATSSDEEDENDEDEDLEFDLPKPTERIIAPSKVKEPDEILDDNNQVDNLKRTAAKITGQAVPAKKAKLIDPEPAKILTRRISVKLRRGEVERHLEEEARNRSKKSSRESSKSAKEAAEKKKDVREPRATRQKKLEPIGEVKEVEIRQSKRNKPTNVDESPKEKKYKADETKRAKRSNKSEDTKNTKTEDTHSKTRGRKKETVTSTSNDTGVKYILASESAKTPVTRFSSPRKPTRIEILFTQVNPAPYTDAIGALGGCIVDTPQLGKVLICNKISRTFKFLFALAKGVPIVTSEWLDRSLKGGKFLPTESYLTIDKVAEKRFKFSLKESLESAQRKPLFINYHIFATQNVQPTTDEIAEIVECSGGKYGDSVKRKSNSTAILVSHKKDCKLWPKYRKSHPDIKIVSSEWFMECVVKQTIDFARHILD